MGPVGRRRPRAYYSAGFNLLSMLLNLANAVIVGIEVDSVLQHSLQKAAFREGRGNMPEALNLSFVNLWHWFFAAWLLLEVLFGVVVLQRQYIDGPDRGWNIFDLVMLVAAFSALFMSSNLSYVRLVRVFKMIRVFRIAKTFKAIAGLRTMLISIYGSGMSLFWAAFLLVLINYIFGVFLSEEISAGLSHVGPRRLHVSSNLDRITEAGAEQRRLHLLSSTDRLTTIQALESRYGSLGRCMATLLYSISGGDWGALARPVADISTTSMYIYAAYVMLVVFGILNILTGTFVDTAMQASANDRDNAIEASMQARTSAVNKLKEIFEETDTDGSGKISFEEFEQSLQNSEVAHYLDSMGLDPTEARGLFQLLDVDNSKSIWIDELVSGCMKLKGQAKSVDVATLIYENKRMMKRHLRFSDFCRSRFERLDRTTQSIANSMALLEKPAQTSA